MTRFRAPAISLCAVLILLPVPAAGEFRRIELKIAGMD
jgi:hypothetical protein